jgi:hypothetical protein
VAAQPADPNASPTEQPSSGPPPIQHTPTLRQGQLSNFAEPVTNTPVGVPISVADDPTQPVEEQGAPTVEQLAGALLTRAAGQIEIAAPAPLPRPGDEQLLRGTAAGAALQEKLTGVAPEMPGDPESDEARQAEIDARKAALDQAREAAQAQIENQQLVEENQPQPQENQPAA